VRYEGEKKIVCMRYHEHIVHSESMSRSSCRGCRSGTLAVGGTFALPAHHPCGYSLPRLRDRRVYTSGLRTVQREQVVLHARRGMHEMRHHHESSSAPVCPLMGTTSMSSTSSLSSCRSVANEGGDAFFILGRRTNPLDLTAQ
jgi:hypothetical protein